MLPHAIWFVKRINLFRTLDADALDKLGRMSNRRTYQRRQLVFGSEDPGDSVYLVRSGRVKLSRFDDRGREITLAILEEGEIFGEEALVDGRSRNGYAECIDESTLEQVSREEFERLMAEQPSLAVAVTQQLSERLLGAHDRIASLVFREVPQRLAAVLVQLVEQHGVERAGGSMQIQLRLTHQELANLIASTRETTTSLLGRFKREGLVETEGRFLVVTDVRGLRTLAESE